MPKYYLYTQCFLFEGEFVDIAFPSFMHNIPNRRLPFVKLSFPCVPHNHPRPVFSVSEYNSQPQIIRSKYHISMSK
jgi:hypothetical protein